MRKVLTTTQSERFGLCTTTGGALCSVTFNDMREVLKQVPLGSLITITVSVFFLDRAICSLAAFGVKEMLSKSFLHFLFLLT